MRIFIVPFILAATTAAAQPAPPSAPPESITVTATPLPGRSAVDEFIYSYPHVTRQVEKIPRWKDGICPVVEGVPARYAAFVTKRVTAIAQKVGAPVSSDPNCQHNIQILFTARPQDAADQIAKDHRAYLGYFDNLHQAEELAKVTHDIQAWYLTATVDYNGGWRIDNPRANFFNTESYGFTGGNDGDYLAFGRIGGRINNGIASYLYNVIIVADSSKLKDYEIGSLADYIAMLALSHPKSFDACWEVPSITNLLSRNCEAMRKTATLSDNDAAFLQGLYKMAPGDSEFSQRAEIRYYVGRTRK